MQIKFLNIYNYYDTEVSQVQYELLEFWQKGIVYDQIDFIHKAKVEFNDYSFEEYVNQAKLKNDLHKSTVSGYDSRTESDFWFANKKCYTCFEELYNDLAKTHHLMELVITVKEE
jgi:hypothetical protein